MNIQPIRKYTTKMGIKRIIHVSDLHIRSGDSHVSRYEEYKIQIDRFLASVSKYEYETTIVVVTGDLFHDKSKMGPCGQLLAQQLFRGLSQVAIKTIVIMGNHDYRQDAPLEPDLITPFFDDIPENVHYLNETILWQYDDIEFGVVHVKETLVKGAGSGINTTLPEFPNPTHDDPSITHNIALFHGSFGGALLQNGTDADVRFNYPLEWIRGYTLRLFGDIHVQQVHNAKIQPGSDFTNRTKQNIYTVGKYNLDGIDKQKSPWGYAGSLIQQNFGESLWGHGFVEWNLETMTAHLHHVPNNFGYVIATINQAGVPCVKVRIGKTNQYIPIKTIVTYAWFPEIISLRFSTKARDSTENIQAAFEEAGVVVKDTGFVEENNVEETDVTISTSESKESLVNDLTTLNSPDTWVKFFTENAKIDDGEWTQWVRHPHLLSVPTDIFPADVKARLDKRNTDFAKQVDKYMHCRDERNPVRHFRVHFIEFAWLLCFGADNFLNLDGFTKKVSLISGNNGSGKSSLLEILCLAIYGESFPSRYNKNFSSAVINQHKPQGESAYARVCFSIDGKKYWVTRTFEQAQTNPRNLWQRTVKLIEEESGEIVKQTSTSVDPWIEQHVSKYVDFLMTTIVSQSNDSDFFLMKSSEQKAIIDSLLQLDVVEEYNKILHQSSLDHNYALQQLSTYEAGRKDVSKLLNTMSNTDITGMEERKSILHTEIQNLNQQRTKFKELYCTYPEKIFQTPLYEYENDKHQMTIETASPPEGEISDLKQQRQKLRDRLAVLRTKRYKQQQQQQQQQQQKQEQQKQEQQKQQKNKTTDAVTTSFDALESKLENLRNERLTRGGKVRLYDSKAHNDWLESKANWYKTHTEETTDKTLRELEQNRVHVQAEYDELKDDIDEEEHKPVTEKVLKGLEKQHNELLEQKQEAEQAKKHLYREIQSIKAILTPQVKDLLQTYQEALETLKTTFNAEPSEAETRLRTVAELNVTQTHLQNDRSKLQGELQELAKIKFNKDCSACLENPYKHKREAMEKELLKIEASQAQNKKKIQQLLNADYTYEEMKAIYDTWSSKHTNKMVTLLDNQTRLQVITEEHKTLTKTIADLADDIEDVGFESQTNINEFYQNKQRLIQLENLIGHLKFTEEEKEYVLSKEVSDLDNEIQLCEQHTTIAYMAELKAVEEELHELDNNVELHDKYSLASIKLKNVTDIIQAYPYYQEVQCIDTKLKPLNQELSAIEASLHQAKMLSAQMSEAKTFEQQIGSFRQLLEQRSTMINKLSDAYNKYTSWLYPEKVGPAIETAVNEVLNSIALPRPITLEGEWDTDKGYFVWYVRDGNSRPPYEKCSGAQRFFIGLAIRIALGRLGSSNMINDQIFIDEGFTACDAETMDRVPSLLNNLLKDSNKLNAVFMVSHLEQLKSAAAASIPIVRGAMSSKLTVGERQVAPRGIPTQDTSVVKKTRGRPKKAEQLIEVAE